MELFLKRSLEAIVCFFVSASFKLRISLRVLLVTVSQRIFVHNVLPLNLTLFLQKLFIVVACNILHILHLLTKPYFTINTDSGRTGHYFSPCSKPRQKRFDIYFFHLPAT
jgi:hypothetical protein